MLAHCSGDGTQETGIIEYILDRLSDYAPFAVEFGQRHLGGGTLGEVVRSRQLSLLNLDVEASKEEDRKTPWGDERTWTLLKCRVSPLNINGVFDANNVPDDLAVAVIDVDGMDYWCMLAMLQKRRPALLIVEYNCHIPPQVSATLVHNPDHTYQKDKNYGASLRAFCELAAYYGYRLVHIHGPMNLYFVSENRAADAVSFDLSDKLKHLSAEDFAAIADTELFYDSFLSTARPSWFNTADPDPLQSPWIQLDQIGTSTQTLKIDEVVLEVFAADKGGEHYRQRGHKEDSVSPLWNLIRQNLRPATLIDIGANYGYTTSLLAKRLGVRQAIAVEPDPRLASILKKNLGANLPDIDFRTIEASVSSKSGHLSAMGLNPFSTQDNRLVAQKNWTEAVVRSVTLEMLLHEVEQEAPFFIKCDTQGYDTDVIASGWHQLLGRPNWMLRFEFAPHWMESQSFEPVKQLQELCRSFRVFEAPLRTSYRARFEDVFQRPIRESDAEEFTNYVRSLNHGGMGWVDLYMLPMRKQLFFGFRL